LANAGFRFGEVTALKRKHFSKVQMGDVERYVVNVNEGVVLVEREFIEGSPKSAAGVREVVLPSVLTQIVDDHLANSVEPDSNSLVFPAANGTHLRNDVLNKAMKGAAKRASVESSGVAPHAFRRGAATALSNAGANIAEVQEFLGDASPAAALRYISTTNRQVDLIERIATILPVAKSVAKTVSG
jgi:integrase